MATKWTELPGLEQRIKKDIGYIQDFNIIDPFWGKKADEVLGSYEQFLGRTPSVDEVMQWIRIDGAPDQIKASDEAKLHTARTGGSNEDTVAFLDMTNQFQKLTGGLPPALDSTTYTPEEYAKNLTPEQLKQFNYALATSLNNGAEKRNATDAMQIMDNITKGVDLGTKPQIVVPGEQPKTPTTPPVAATDWTSKFNDVLASNPAWKDTKLTMKDFGLAQKGYEALGFDATTAGNYALDDIKTYAGKEVVDTTNKAAVDAKVANLPAEIKAQYDKLNAELEGFQTKTFKDKIMPAIEQKLNARGALDSGALNVALANAAGDATNSRLEAIAPLVSEATVGGLKEQYADLLRDAQESGVELSNPGAFMNTFYTPTYNTNSQKVQNAFTGSENSLSRSLQNALSKRATDLSKWTTLTSQAWQDSWLNKSLKSKQDTSEGNLAGQIAAILAGAGLGALSTPATPWVGAGTGALYALTGKYKTNY